MTPAPASTPGKPQRRSDASAGRLGVLDGLRGVAALLVVCYHLTARWTVKENGQSLYPYGDGLLTAMPYLDLLGTFGVSLFFLISGFVMIMTLQRSSGLTDFVVRRAARLWPVMLFCATVTTVLIAISGIYLRYESIAIWEVTPLEYFTSILFIDPAFIGDLTHTGPMQWVDGVYWTLWIEVRFYALVALVYWMSSGGPRFLWGWMFVQALSVVLLLSIDYSNLHLHWTLSLVLQPYHLAFFSLGISAWYYWSGRLSRGVIALAALSLVSLLLSAISTSHHGVNSDILRHILLDVFVVSIFALFIFLPSALKFLEHRWAVALGLASYPLYMFHERVGVIVMNALADIGFPPMLILPVVLAAIVAAALAIHRFLETPSKDFMLSAGLPVSRMLERKWPALQFRGGARLNQSSEFGPSTPPKRKR